jgi:hypothetical protein
VRFRFSLYSSGVSQISPAARGESASGLSVTFGQKAWAGNQGCKSGLQIERKAAAEAKLPLRVVCVKRKPQPIVSSGGMDAKMRLPGRGGQAAGICPCGYRLDGTRRSARAQGAGTGQPRWRDVESVENACSAFMVACFTGLARAVTIGREGRRSSVGRAADS